jgi:hypothetical protein
MDTNTTVAIVSASSALIVAITALILNTFWVRYAIQSLDKNINQQITSLRNELKSELLRVEGVLDARLSQVEQILKIR